MRPQDLNLLMVFDAIMTERSITRAADRLAMTQPAVSNAVSRMRVAWKDEVFVKQGRNIQPTLYAQNLWNQIKDPILHLSEAIDPQSFEPAKERRTFRVAVADIIAEMLMVPLRQLLEREAPNINIHLIPYTIVNAQQVLEDAEVDLVVGALATMPGEIRNDLLFQTFYVCAMRPGHPLAKRDMSVEEFAAANHLLVSLSGDTTGFTDTALAQHGLSRRIACSVNQFSLVPSLLTTSDLIAVVPCGVVVDEVINGTLVATCPPLDMAPTSVSIMWHKRQDKDAGMQWIRQHIKAIVSSTGKREIADIKRHLCQENPAQCSDGLHI